MGLPHLTFVQKCRVQKANFLYAWTCKMILALDAKSVGWSIENPASSLMWITTPFMDLLTALPNLVAFSFHTCMFAAKRKKDTALWTSVPELRMHVERKCDDSHPHLGWGQTSTGFATAEECAYNDAMSAAWAEAISDFALNRNYFAPPTTVQEASAATASSTYINKAILGCLPRGRKMLPMMSEHLQPQLFDISHVPEVQQLPLGKRIPDSCTSFPKGSELLRFCNADGGADSTPKLGLPIFAMIGIAKSPDDFLKEACKRIHPTAMAMTVCDVMTRNIDFYNDATGLGFRRLQCDFAKRLLAMCEDLKTEEQEIRAPEIPETFLRKMARSFTARSLAVTKSSGCPEADTKLWEATLEEVGDGFREGSKQTAWGLRVWFRFDLACNREPSCDLLTVLLHLRLTMQQDFKTSSLLTLSTRSVL
eukprot:s4628_g15.t1